MSELIENDGKNTYIVYVKKADGEFEKTNHEFKGRVPSQAAKKVARHTGLTDFYLRETRTKKLRHFEGSIGEKITINPTVEWMKTVAKPNADGDLVYTAKIGVAKYIPGIEIL